MRPLVSVVIPAYGHAEFIEQALESVFAQRPGPVEVIVVNDGSPDDTHLRLRALVSSGRIRYVEQANAGQAAARNRGAALARGRYLAFLDDDDLWLPDTLACLVDLLERTPGSPVAFGGAVLLHQPAPLTSGPAGTGAVSTLEWLRLFIGNPMLSPGQALIRREAFVAAGGCDAAIWGADDWDLWFRLLALGPAVVIDRPVLWYRQHATNASRDVARLAANVLRVLRPRYAQLHAADRTLVRGLSHHAVSQVWRPRVLAQARGAARAGDGRTLARACAVYARLLTLEVTARLAIKVHLVRRGRWVAGPDPLAGCLPGDPPPCAVPLARLQALDAAEMPHRLEALEALETLEAGAPAAEGAEATEAVVGTRPRAGPPGAV